MRTWRTRLATAPLWVIFLYFTIVFGALIYLIEWLLGEHQSTAGWLGGVLAYGVVMTGVTAYGRRRYGGARRSLQVRMAIKKGELPEDADSAFWDPALARQERSIRRWRWVVPVEFGAFCVLALGLAIVVGPVWWAFVGFFAAFGGYLVVIGGRNLRNIRKMQAQLGSADAPLE